MSVGNVLLIVLVNLPHYASDSVIKYNKDESVLIFPKKGIATFISAPTDLLDHLRTKSELLLWH